MDNREFRKRFEQAARDYNVGKFPAAARELERLVREFPEHPDLLHTYARTLAHLGKRDDAEEICAALEQLGDPRANTLRSRIRGESGDPVGSELAYPAAEAARSGTARRRGTALVVVVVLSAIALYAYYVVFPRTFRVLRFDETRSIGMVHTREMDESGQEGRWEPFFDARGTHVVLRSRELQLNIAPSAFESAGNTNALRALLSFEPDTFAIIDATGAPIGDDGLGMLASLSDTRVWRLRDSGIGGPGLVHLPAQGTIEELDLSANAIDDQWVPWIEQIDALKRLDISETRISDNGLAKLGTHEALQELTPPSSMGDDGAKAIQTLSTLIRLDVSKRPLTDRASKFLGKLSNLEDLDISGTAIGDIGLRRLVPLTKLRTLNLSDTYVTDDAADVLASFTALEHVGLARTAIGNEGVQRIAGLPALRTLDIARCFQEWPMGAATGAALARTSIVDLNLSRSSLEPGAITALGALASLRRLTLEQTAVSEVDVDAVRNQLPGCDVQFSLPEERTYRFSNTESLGRVYVPSTNSAGGRAWAFWDDLSGALTLPGNAPLRVELSPTGWEQLALIAESIGPSIESLSTDHFPAVAVDFSPLMSMEALRHVELLGAPPPAFLESIAQSSTKDLDISSAVWTSVALAAAPILPNIEQLTISGSIATLPAPERLGIFPSLSTLAIHAQDFVMPAPDAVPALTVTTLDLRGCRVSEESGSALAAALPQTEVLFDPITTRTLQFPDALSVGSVWTRNAESPSAPWSLIGNARGTVTVPESHVVRLDVSTQSPGSLAALRSIDSTAIHTLNLTGATVTDDSLQPLLRWTALRDLDVSGSQVSDSGVRALGEASPGFALDPTSPSLFKRPFLDLRRLSLSGTRVRGATLDRLRGFLALERLDLSGSPVEVTSTNQLAELHGLTELGLEETPLARLGAGSLARRLPNTSIALSGPGDEPVPRKYPARVLQAMDDTTIGEVAIRPAKRSMPMPWKTIGPLDDAMTIPIQMESRLALGPTDLNELDALSSVPGDAFDAIEIASGTDVSVEQIAALAHFHDLRSLDLSGTNLRPGALASLGGFHQLESLSLANARFDPAELWVLRNLRKLKRVDLSGTGAGDEAMPSLASLPHLSDVLVNDNMTFSDVGAAYVSRMKGLKRLEARGSRISANGVRAVTRAPRVEYVDAYDTPAAAENAATQDTLVNTRKRSIPPRELAALTPKIKDSIRAAPGQRGSRLTEALGVESLEELDEESLARVQELAMEGAREYAASIDQPLLAEIAGSRRLRDASPAIRAPLQRAALRALARQQGDISIETLTEVADVKNLRELSPNERSAFQESALIAIAETRDGIRTEDILLLEGAIRMEEVGLDRLRNVQNLALTAMSRADRGITLDGLVEVSGAGAFAQIPESDLDSLRQFAMSAMASSEDVFTPEELAALSGHQNFWEISEIDLVELQEIGMSAMAQSEIGIRHQGIAALGGEDYYDDLVEDSMGGLQDLAVQTMVNSDLAITTETFSQIGGRDNFEEIPYDRKSGLQGTALSAMADSSIGITAQSLVEIGGVEEFSQLDEDELGSLQDVALLAMANSSKGITVDGLAVLTGTDSLDRVSREAVDSIRKRAVTAMGKSTTGIQPSKLAEILGDTALTELLLAQTPVGDVDLLNIPDFSSLEVVDLAGCSSITDRGVERLAAARELRVLNLAGTQVTSQGLFALANLEKLESLDISRTGIADSALAALNSFPRLRTLSVAETRLSGVGLTYLVATSELRTLDLSGTEVTDSGFEYAPALPALEALALRRTRVSDASVGRIGSFAQLRTLDVAECPAITDDGFARLASLRELASLELHDTGVSERSVPILVSFDGLTYLTVNHGRFSTSSINSIQQALPRCTVSGIGTLYDEMQELQELVADTATAADRFRQAAMNRAMQILSFLFSLMLLLTTGLYLVAPFLPAYLIGLDRLQRSGATGRFAQGTGTFARATYIVTTRGGSALLYASRWLFLFALACVGIYFMVTVAVDFWDTYLENRTLR